MVGYEDFRHLHSLLRALVDNVPAVPKARSKRYFDNRVIAEAVDSHTEVAQPIEDLNNDARLFLDHLGPVVDGLADVLEIAAQRNNEVNGPSLAYIVRPALELGGQLAWLLDDCINAHERARRYLMWRLADLRAKRLLLNSFRTSGPLTAETQAELDRDERRVLAFVEAIGWNVRSTSFNGPHLEAACLLDGDGKPEKVPAWADFVREVSSTPSTYGLLSVTAHCQRFGTLEGIRRVEPSSEGGYSQNSGFLLRIDLILGLAVLATDISGRMLGGWNGLDTDEFHAHCGQLIDTL